MKMVIVLSITLLSLIACTSSCDEETIEETYNKKEVNEIIAKEVPSDDAKLWKEDQIARHDTYPALVY